MHTGSKIHPHTHTRIVPLSRPDSNAAPPPPVPRAAALPSGGYGCQQIAQGGHWRQTPGAYGYGSEPHDSKPSGASLRRANIQEFQVSRSSKHNSTTHLVLAAPHRFTIFCRMFDVTGGLVRSLVFTVPAAEITKLRGCLLCKDPPSTTGEHQNVRV